MSEYFEYAVPVLACAASVAGGYWLHWFSARGAKPMDGATVTQRRAKRRDVVVEVDLADTIMLRTNVDAVITMERKTSGWMERRLIAIAKRMRRKRADQEGNSNDT